MADAAFSATPLGNLINKAWTHQEKPGQKPSHWRDAKNGRAARE